MGHGGARAGSGRKPGQATTKTRQIAEASLASGLSPLEVMLKAMRAHLDADPPRMDAASSIAKDAAPYVHPRLATIEASGPDGGPLQVEVVRFVDAIAKDGTGDA